MREHSCPALHESLVLRRVSGVVVTASSRLLPHLLECLVDCAVEIFVRHASECRAQPRYRGAQVCKLPVALDEPVEILRAYQPGDGQLSSLDTEWISSQPHRRATDRELSRTCLSRVL